MAGGVRVSGPSCYTNSMATVQARPAAERVGTEALEEALAAVARRLRLARWVRHASRSMLVALGVGLIAVALDHFDLLPDALPLAFVLPALLALGVIIGTVTTFARPISHMTVARVAETRLGLKERLSSALEFQGDSHIPDTFRQMQQRDAQEYARRLKATEAAPMPVTWETRALLPAVLILTLALILPNLPVLEPHQVRVEHAIVQKEGQKLARTARIIQKQAQTQSLPATRRAAAAMQQLAHQMTRGHMDKRQAMVRMAQLTQQMQAQQRQLAQQAGSAALNGGKSLAQAGQQLAAALRSQHANGQNGQGQSKSQGANGSSSKDKGSQSGKSGAAEAKKNAPQGFNVPGKKQPANGSQPASSQPSDQQTPEVQQAAQAMQNNDVQTLSQQLRQLSQRTASGQMSPGQQQQAARDLQSLSQALQGTGMPQTRQHVQAAAQAMAHGDTKTAAQELQKAADAAQREAQEQQDAAGMQNAQQSLQDSQDEIAGAQSPSDITQANQQGQPCPPGQVCQPCQPGQPCLQSNQQGNGPPITANGPPGNGGHGGGRGKPQTAYQKGQRPSGRVIEKPGSGKGAPHWLDPHFDPTKNPNYRKLYFGGPKTAGPSQPGVSRLARPGASGPVQSAVPYYNTVTTARKTAESAMDREDIPPAYKNDVAKYFNSLQQK